MRMVQAKAPQCCWVDLCSSVSVNHHENSLLQTPSFPLSMHHNFSITNRQGKKWLMLRKMFKRAEFPGLE